MGFKPVRAEWPSVYIRKETNLLLVVYVDDFKMSGPKGNLKKGWDLLRTKLEIEPETETGRGLYVGCNQIKEGAQGMLWQDAVAGSECCRRCCCRPRLRVAQVLLAACLLQIVQGMLLQSAVKGAAADRCGCRVVLQRLAAEARVLLQGAAGAVAGCCRKLVLLQSAAVVCYRVLVQRAVLLQDAAAGCYCRG